MVTEEFSVVLFETVYPSCTASEKSEKKLWLNPQIKILRHYQIIYKRIFPATELKDHI